MKQRIFNRGKKWYISCSNYKDENDKSYVNLFFPGNTEPKYVDNGRGFSSKLIDIEEAKFTSYHEKPELTIFKYRELEEEPRETKSDQVALNDGKKDMFGGNTIISTEELPFY